MLVLGFNGVLRDDEVGREAQFDFVRFVTLVESDDGLGTRKLMCTPNVSKIDDDNGNGKRFGAFFYFNCVLRDDEVHCTMRCREGGGPLL